MRIHEINTVNGRYEMHIDEVHAVKRLKKGSLLGVTSSGQRVETVILKVLRFHNVLGMRKVTAANVTVTKLNGWGLLLSRQGSVIPAEDLDLVLGWYSEHGTEIAKWLEKAPFHKRQGGGGQKDAAASSP